MAPWNLIPNFPLGYEFKVHFLQTFCYGLWCYCNGLRGEASPSIKCAPLIQYTLFILYIILSKILHYKNRFLNKDPWVIKLNSALGILTVIVVQYIQALKVLKHIFSFLPPALFICLFHHQVYREFPFKRQVPTCSTTVCRYGSVCRERKRIRFGPEDGPNGPGPAVQVREEIIGTECHCDYDCQGIRFLRLRWIQSTTLTFQIEDTARKKLTRLKKSNTMWIIELQQ